MWCRAFDRRTARSDAAALPELWEAMEAPAAATDAAHHAAQRHQDRNTRREGPAHETAGADAIGMFCLALRDRDRDLPAGGTVAAGAGGSGAACCFGAVQHMG